jgi:hypothetical protein
MLPPPLKMKDAIELFNRYTHEKHSFVVFDLMSNPSTIQEMMFQYQTGEEISKDAKIDDYVGKSTGNGGVKPPETYQSRAGGVEHTAPKLIHSTGVVNRTTFTKKRNHNQ